MYIGLVFFNPIIYLDQGLAKKQKINSCSVNEISDFLSFIGLA